MSTTNLIIISVVMVLVYLIQAVKDVIMRDKFECPNECCKGVHKRVEKSTGGL